jgi:D-alanine-D-alanine ligase
MTQPKKLRVAVLYGGRSGEHAVSLRSAASVIRHLDRERYEVVPVGIDPQGRWYLNDVSLIEKAARSPESTLPLIDKFPVTLMPNASVGENHVLTTVGGAQTALESSAPFDVIFPVMHGTFAEDGTIQGLLEMAQVPYVGAGVLGSALGMDKEVAKRLVHAAGLPIVPYVCARNPRESAQLVPQISAELGFPCFVKPVNAGSSVGVHKVKEPSALVAAIEDAFRYDTKVLIEQGIDAREIEVSVLENIAGGEPLASIPGEIEPHHEFYSYEAKYLDENGASLLIPARLSAKEVHQVQAIAIRVFQILELEGMARVDFFMSKSTGEIYFNEVNTIPGFTSISMYPKMWEASGLPYSALLTKLIELAIARHKRRAELVREFHVK